MDTENIWEQLSENHINSVLWDSHIKRAQSAFQMKNFPEAVCMCEMAMQKCLPLGIDDWRVLVTQRLLARFLMQAKQYEKAEFVLCNMMEMIRTRFGDHSPELLEVERMLAGVLEHRSKFHKAAKIMQHVVNNHPQRQSNDLDFQGARRKYDSLKRKAEEQDTWALAS